MWHVIPTCNQTKFIFVVFKQHECADFISFDLLTDNKLKRYLLSGACWIMVIGLKFTTSSIKIVTIFTANFL